ncbi:MAG: GNAT family N-acetyltransferase [Deltaproteobacteria bacterium]|nr:GNAT family N-acetyltransferase [Deltaproteobacteria bacterium]
MTSWTTTFRRASAGDIDAILPHMTVFNEEELIAFKPDKGRRALGELLRHPEWGFVLLAEVDESVVGYALVAYGFDIEYGGRDAFLCELFIAREHRAHGLGRSLLEVAEAEARDAEVSALHLLVRNENTRAKGLYERSGFVVDPRPLMTKPLVSEG